jgi:general stress protein 26
MDMRLKFLSDNMKAIDFGMLSTRTEGGAFASRPMSNNGEVDYDGDSYFFLPTTRPVPWRTSRATQRSA